jgi:2-oxoisovalerate dehydrogenase E1 component
MVHASLAAAEALASDGLDVEVVDLRSVVPWDIPTVAASVRKTGRLVVVHEAVTDFGIGAEIVASIVERELPALRCAPVRVGAPPTPPPYAPAVEQAWLPSVDRITAALRGVMAEPLAYEHHAG